MANNNGKKPNRAVQIMAIVLAALMVSGAVITIVTLLL